MRISKHHGLRNDFLVLLDEVDEAPATAGPELARQLCDRRSGIGADGLIHGAAPAPGSGADVVMRLWNADGSRAEMSGNGIRCLAQAVLRARGLEAGTLCIDSDSGLREVIVKPGPGPGEVEVAVELGEISPGPAVTELVAGLPALRYGTVSLGNPHLVVLVADLDAVDLASAGAALQEAVPGGINVEAIRPGTAPGELVLEVYERGVGITEACGTGACAAAFLAREWGLVGDEVTVVMPGGSVRVELRGDDVALEGPAVHIADVVVDEYRGTDV